MTAVVHLIGFPGCGKYTIAQALADAADDRFVVMDNHLTGNPILKAVVPTTTEVVPAEVWDRVHQVREIVFTAIEDLGPPDASYVFTNVLLAHDTKDQHTLERVARLAKARRARYLPVHVRCDLPVLLDRVPSASRAARNKWTDPDAVARHIEQHEIIDLAAYAPLDLDTTTTTPQASARLILDHLAQREVIGGG